MLTFQNIKIKMNSPSVPIPAIFYAHRCESPVKSTNQVRRFYHDCSKWWIADIIGAWEEGLSATLLRSAEKIAKCVHINQW